MRERTQSTYEISRYDELKDHLDKCLKKAVHDLYLNDFNLLFRAEVQRNRNDHVSERSIVFRLGIYLQNYISKDIILQRYDLDSEYNRNGYRPKILPSWPNGAYPDLIIHKRGSNLDNLLVIECKGGWSEDNDQDRIKIKELMEADEFRYMFGLLLTFQESSPTFEWVE